MKFILLRICIDFTPFSFCSLGSGRGGRILLAENQVELLHFSLSHQFFIFEYTLAVLDRHLLEYSRVNLLFLYIVPNDTINNISRKVTQP